jgi:hypothetical protein
MNLRWRLLPALALILAATAGCATSSAPEGTPPAPPTPLPTQTATSPPEPSGAPTPTPGSELTLERLDDFPAGPATGAVIAVAEGGPGLVAIGYDGLSGTVIWTSIDGRRWEAVPQSPDLVDAGMADLVAAGRRLVAVGRGNTTDVDNLVAAAWVSEDGVTWRRTAGGPDMEGGQLIDVIQTDDGFLAIGGIVAADAAAVWTSPDGETWQRAAAADPDLEHAFMWAVTQGGPGFVAVGWRRNPEPDLAVWTSTDGQDWALAPDPPGAAGFEGRDVAEIGGSLVMVGGLVTGGEVAAWVSSDGKRWEAADPSDSFSGAAVNAVIRTPAGLLAVGSRGDDAAAWTSVDGRSWTVVEDDALADAYLDDVFAIDEGSVAVGATQHLVAGTDGSYVTTPMIWFGSPSEP